MILKDQKNTNNIKIRKNDRKICQIKKINALLYFTYRYLAAVNKNRI